MATLTQTRQRKNIRASSRKVKTITMLVEDFLIGHESQNHSPKTLEWHKTSLGYLLRYLEKDGVTDPLEFETDHLRRLVIWLSSPESSRLQKGHRAITPRSKRTVNTYTRSAHAGRSGLCMMIMYYDTMSVSF